MLHVIEAASQSTISSDQSKMTVTLESDLKAMDGAFTAAFDELNSPAARNLATAYGARCGLASARINGNPQGPYPVNVEGLSLDQIKDDKGNSLPVTHPKMKPERYRIDVPITKPLG